MGVTTKTEHQLQQELFLIWKEHGLTVDGTRFFLIGDEVQEDWCRNDWVKGAGAALPSIDYLFADIAGQLWALELKPRRLAPRPALELLIQVTLRSCALARNLSMDKIRSVFTRAYDHGDLEAAHQAFYRLPAPISSFGTDRRVHRMVASPGLGEHVINSARLFQAEPLDAVKATTQTYTRHPTRISEFMRLDGFHDAKAWQLAASTDLWILDLAMVGGEVDGTATRVVLGEVADQISPVKSGGQ
jgi:hypothetical protein